jgi:hypothetical protein
LLAIVAERLRGRGIVIDVLYSYRPRKRVSDLVADRSVLEALRGPTWCCCPCAAVQ